MMSEGVSKVAHDPALKQTALELMPIVVKLSVSSRVGLYLVTARLLSAALVHTLSAPRLPVAAFKLSYKLWRWQHQPLC